MKNEKRSYEKLADTHLDTLTSCLRYLPILKKMYKNQAEALAYFNVFYEKLSLETLITDNNLEVNNGL